MKHRAIIFLNSLILTGLFSCSEPPAPNPGFEDQEQMTIYDYVALNDSSYSLFMSIMEKGGIAKTLSAYNPDGIGYTLFLPDNNAVNEFIENSDRFSSFEDLLNDDAYVSALARYHVVNLGIDANDFPFGALPEYTLSEDYLTVNFVIEPDTSYYLINNQAPVTKTNIELSNGFIHLIKRMLIPVTSTSYQWLGEHPGYSIFKALIDTTGLADDININTKDPDNLSRPITLLIEHDSVYEKENITSLEDLIILISPDRNDYTNVSNPLFNFAAYHILSESMFLADFVGRATNYTTYSEIPLHINGEFLDIAINKGKDTFDITVIGTDTVYNDYVGFYYDASNVLTQSGAVHFINRVLMQQTPSRAIQTYEFWDEPLLNEYRLEPGEYLIEDTSWLNVVKWSGVELFFIETGDNQSSAWGGDYLFMDGDFNISYTIPKIIQGKYTAFLGAEAFNQENALVEILIDGKSIGVLIDLATGGSAAWPFARIELGTINFLKYEQHTIEIKSLIPGRFCWDYIRFEPFTQ
jgi:uncharacterized surface protein with fasciclin (FAS1) repeats